MDIKGVTRSRKQIEESESQQDTQQTGYTRSDSIENASAAKLQELKALGFEAYLNEQELQQAAEDEKKRKALLDIISTVQILDLADSDLQAAKSRYLAAPTNEVLEDLTFDLAAKSTKAPPDKAREAGIVTAKDLFKLKGDLELIGEDSDAVLSDQSTYDTIKSKGVDGLLSERFIKSNGLPENAKGRKFKDLMNAIAVAQATDTDSSTPEFWDKVNKHGVESVYRDAIARDNAKREGGDSTGPAGRREPKPEGGRFVDEPIHHGKIGATHGRKAQSAINPLSRRKDESKGQTTAPPPPQQQSSNKRSGGAKSSSQTDHNRMDTSSGAGSTKRDRSTHESHRPGGGSEGTQSGNATEGSDSADGPTAGTNPEGGAANNYGSGAGADQQTGVGVSAATGQEARSGAVNTVTGVHHGLDGSTTFSWTRSGGGDGKDGHYRTVYDGNGGWMSFNEDTEELAGQGSGDPPDDSIVGSSSQTIDPDTENMIFDSDDDDDTTTDSTEDDSTTDATDDTGTEGKPIDPLVGGPAHDDVLHPWEITVHVSRTNQLIHTTGSSSGARPPVKHKGEPNDGVTDPSEELQSKRAGGSKRFLRSAGYTDPAPEQSGGHKPATAGDQPKGPSRAKGKGQQRTGHLSSHRTRHR